MPRRKFKLDVVGGPYDGLRGLYWTDNTGELVPPDTIFIGQCPGDGTCYDSRTHCLAEGGGLPHPAYWTPVEGEGARPPETYRYDRRELHEEKLRAVYARGNMGGPPGAEVEVEEPAPLVTARMATYDGALEAFLEAQATMAAAAAEFILRRA